MSILALAALAAAVAVPLARADNTCDPQPTDMPDVGGCDYAPPSVICTPGAGDQRPPDVGFEQILQCANEMQNCACSLIATKNCTTINAAGKIVLGENSGPNLGGQKGKYSIRLDPATGDVTVLLDRASADTVSDAATYTTDEEIDKMRLELHTDLYRLATAVALLDSAKNLADGMTPRGDGAEQRLVLDAMWMRISGGIRACDQMYGRADPSQPDALAWYFRNNLVCGLRSASTLAAHPVYAQWPGCSCDGNTGRMLGDSGACIMTEPGRNTDRFTEKPIDERMPDMLAGFVKMLEARTGYKVKKIGTLGCGFERFETGSNVRNLSKRSASERALRASHISDHARGTACDLAYVTFRIGDCKEWTFKLTTAIDPPGSAKSESERPFYDALLGYLEGHHKKPEEYIWGKKLIAREGTGKFYRDLEKTLSGKPFKTPMDKGFKKSDDYALQLRMGIAIRNALTDSGFVVYDPTTNSSHRDHFHFEIPASDADATTLGAQSQDGEALKGRENVVNRYIWRAAGLVE